MDQNETWHAGRPRPWPHCIRWGPSSPPQRGKALQFSAHICCCHGWMDQDATWCGGRPRPRPHCVTWGPSSPLKRGIAPTFRPMFIVANGWTDQDTTWYEGRPRPRPHCLVWGPSASSPKQNRHSPSPNFRLMSIVAKRSPISATAEHLLSTMLSERRPTMLCSPHHASLGEYYSTHVSAQDQRTKQMNTLYTNKLL